MYVFSMVHYICLQLNNMRKCIVKTFSGNNFCVKILFKLPIRVIYTYNLHLQGKSNTLAQSHMMLLLLSFILSFLLWELSEPGHHNQAGCYTDLHLFYLTTLYHVLKQIRFLNFIRINWFCRVMFEIFCSIRKHVVTLELVYLFKRL